MKSCTKCGESKAPDAFYVSKKARDGRDCACKECRKAGMRANYAANRAAFQEASRRWYERNREAVKEKTRRWTAANPERHRANRSRFASRNPEKMRAYRAAWKQGNREAVALMSQRRRARMAAVAVNDLTQDEWLSIIEAHGRRCVYCGARSKLTMDHVVPISRGGNHTASNVVPACLSCNSSKRDRPAPPFQLPLAG